MPSLSAFTQSKYWLLKSSTFEILVITQKNSEIHMKKKTKIIIIILLAVILLASAGILIYKAVISKHKDVLLQTIGHHNIDARDTTRGADMLVLYTQDYPRNEYGYEVLVEQSTNTVIDEGSMVKFQDGAYILSGHGDAAKFLKRLEIGDIIEIKFNRVIAKRHLKLSNLKKIEINNEKADKLIFERREALYDIDENALEVINKQLEEQISEFNAYFDSLGENTPADTNTVNSKMRLISQLIDMKYYLTIENFTVDGRAMWHSPNATDIDETNLEGVKKFASRIYDMGINTLYVQTYVCGMTTYYSDYLEYQNPKMADCNYGEYGNDYILAIISECHKFGIEVHAWFNVLDSEMPNQESPSYIKDEWVTRDLNGSKKGHFLDPSNPEVVDFLKNVIKEILTKYDFDGISYDYIRFPAAGDYEEYEDSGFTAYAEKLFADTYGYKGTDLLEDVKNNSEIRAQWHSFKQSAINNLLEELGKHIRDIDVEAIISASPFGYLSTAKSVYMQDVETWMKNGYIDVVLPMVYTDDIELHCDLARAFTESSPKTLQYTGVYALYSHYSLKRNQEIIDALKSQGISGVSLFASHNYIGNENKEDDLIYQILSMTTHKGQAVLPTAHPKTILSAWSEQLLDRCDRIYFDRMSESEKQLLNKYIDELSLDISGISDVNVALEILRSFEKAVESFDNQAVAARISSQINYIYGILDAAVYRHTLRYGEQTNVEFPNKP